MMIMPANNSAGILHWIAGQAPGAIGQLFTPARIDHPVSWIPYAVDNGAFSAAIHDRPFDFDAFWKTLDRYAVHRYRPLWAVVPDVPFDGPATLNRWVEVAPRVAETGIPIALAVQNGITVSSVRRLGMASDVIFVGGDTRWKWETMREWCTEFPRVHVARVNGRRGLDACLECGAESCDGSGWFRGREAQLLELVDFIAEHNGLDREAMREAVRSTRFGRRDQMHFPFELEPPK